MYTLHTPCAGFAVDSLLICLPPSPIPRRLAAGARAGRGVQAGFGRPDGRANAHNALAAHKELRGRAPHPAPRLVDTRGIALHEAERCRVLDRVREHQVEVAVVELQQPFAPAAETAPPPNNDPHALAVQVAQEAERPAFTLPVPQLHEAGGGAATGVAAGRAAACRGPVGGAELAAQISGISWRAADKLSSGRTSSKPVGSLTRGAASTAHASKFGEKNSTDSSVTSSVALAHRGRSVRSAPALDPSADIQARGRGLCSVEVDLHRKIHRRPGRRRESGTVPTRNSYFLLQAVYTEASPRRGVNKASRPHIFSLRGAPLSKATRSFVICTGRQPG